MMLRAKAHICSNQMTKLKRSLRNGKERVHVRVDVKVLAVALEVEQAELLRPPRGIRATVRIA